MEQDAVMTSQQMPGATPLATDVDSAVYHHFSVDVEEYFQVSAFERTVQRGQWDSLPSRVIRTTRQLMDLIERNGARGTFFVLGWIAERYPALVREIHNRGHEVASHGHDHARITTLTPDQFRESVRHSKQLLEQIIGTEVLGFRAPSFSIVRGLEWALDILVQEGYAYDSSLFPVSRRGYGYAGGGRDPYWIECPSGTLVEMPPLTLRRLGLNLPAAGGGYLRLLPPSLIGRAIADSEKRRAPATLYIHPWEIDPNQPRLDCGPITSVRHYGGIARTERRLEELLRSHRYLPMAHTLGRMR